MVAALYSSMDMVSFRKALAALLAYIKWQIFLFKAYCCFKEALEAIHLSVNVIIYGGHLQWPSVFKGTVLLCNKLLQSFLFYKDAKLSYSSSCSHAFDECQSKNAIEATLLLNLLYFRRTGIVAWRYHIY